MRGALGPLLPALILGACVAMPFGLKPNRVVEPPPAGWEKLGVHPAYTVREFDDLTALQQFCRDHGSIYEPAKRAGQPYAMACTVNDARTVALPSKKAWPNAGERAALRPHEFAHSWGLHHDHSAKDGGRETWVFGDGSPAFPLTDDQVRMMRDMAERSTPRLMTQPPAPVSGPRLMTEGR